MSNDSLQNVPVNNACFNLRFPMKFKFKNRTASKPGQKQIKQTFSPSTNPSGLLPARYLAKKKLITIPLNSSNVKNNNGTQRGAN